MNYFNYFSEIEETFIRRRGKSLLLSPLDWALIETWNEKKIPLHIVLRGIEKVFDIYDAKPKKKRTIKSLSYCREEVEAQYEDWLETQVGKADGEDIAENDTAGEYSSQTINNYLESLTVDLENAKKYSANNLLDVLEKVIYNLNQLKSGFGDPEGLETDLTNLEKQIDAVLLTNASNERKEEVEKELSGYKKQVESEVYRESYNLLLLKKLRDDAKIPRLSLFYL